jgi:hypothetical protein
MAVARRRRIVAATDALSARRDAFAACPNGRWYDSAVICWPAKPRLRGHLHTATVTQRHQQALDADLHVLCEKPWSSGRPMHSRGGAAARAGRPHGPLIKAPVT